MTNPGKLKRLMLVDVETYRYGQNHTRRGNVYTVHKEPPVAAAEAPGSEP
ncbi:hypothetical protein [Streptacidiphilus sp. MAP12-33]